MVNRHRSKKKSDGFSTDPSNQEHEDENKDKKKRDF